MQSWWIPLSTDRAAQQALSVTMDEHDHDRVRARELNGAARAVRTTPGVTRFDHGCWTPTPGAVAVRRVPSRERPAHRHEGSVRYPEKWRDFADPAEGRAVGDRGVALLLRQRDGEPGGVVLESDEQGCQLDLQQPVYSRDFQGNAGG